MWQETTEGIILLEVEQLHTQDLQTDSKAAKHVIESGFSGWGTEVYYLHDMEKVDITALMNMKVTLPHTVELIVNWVPTLNESQRKLVAHMENRDLIYL